MNKLFKTAIISAISLCFAMPSFANGFDSLNKKEEKSIVLKNQEVSKNTAVEQKFETTIFGLPLNEGPIDRSLRAVVGLGLLGTGIYGLTTKSISPEISWTLTGVSVIPLATASTGYCPLYQVFGIKYTF